MTAYPIDEDYRFIDSVQSDELFEIYDQVAFENSMESLDEMAENGETTTMT